MACSNPQYINGTAGATSEQERINFFQITRLILDIGTDVLRRFLGIHIVQQTGKKSLEQFLNNYETLIRRLLQRKILQKKQIALVFPGGKSTDDASEWDISLLSAIIINCCTINPNETQAIETIRDLRNSVVAHRQSASLGNDEFNAAWTKTVGALDVILNSVGAVKFQEQIKKEIKAIRSDVVQVNEDMLKKIQYQLERLVSVESGEIGNSVQPSVGQQSGLKDVQSFLMKIYKPMTDVKVNQRAIRVADLYVDPNVYHVDSRQDNVTINDRSIHETLVEHFSELFKNDPSNVYVVGAPGRGKTTFCLRLVERWCNGVKELLTEDLVDFTRNGDELYLAKTFDLVLMVCLRNADVEESIENMIRKQLFVENDKHFQYVKEQISKCPGRVLIILDGLDEWQTFSTGSMPSRQNLNNTLTLVTARHSALEKVTVTSHDHVFEIREMDERKVRQLVENILRNVIKVHEPCQIVDDFMNACQDRKLSLVSEVPLVLTFLVALWYKTGEFGNSRTETYCQLVEFILRGKPSVETTSTSRTKQNLPALFENCEACIRQQDLLLSLGSFAFDCILNDDQSLVHFNKAALEGRFGKERMDQCLSTGLLSISPLQSAVTPEKVTVDYFHKTIQDFLVALFIVSDTKNQKSLQKFFYHKNNIQRVLNSKDVLTFICGLDPHESHRISAHISRTCAHSKDIRDFRCSLDERYVFGQRNSFYSRVKSVQNLQLNCYLESNLNRQSGARNPSQQVHVAFGIAYERRAPPDKFTLQDVIIVDKIDDQLLDIIAPNMSQVRSIYVDLPDTLDTGVLQQAITETTTLERLHMDRSCSKVIAKMSPKQLKLLRSLTWVVYDLYDLPRQMEWLNALTVLSLELTGSHKLIEDLQDFFRTKSRLQELELKKVQCKDLYQCKTECKTVMDLSKLVNLRRLRMDDVNNSCAMIAAESGLSEIEITGMMNNPSTVFCSIPHLPLTMLTVGGFGQFKWRQKDYDSLYECLSELKSLTHLCLVGVRYFYFKLNPKARKLASITFQNVNFTDDGWCKFLDSLANTRCKASVDILNSIPPFSKEIEAAARKLFEDVSITNDFYRFQTKGYR